MHLHRHSINPTLLVTPLLLNRALMRLCWYCSSQRLWKTRHPENVRSHGFVLFKKLFHYLTEKHWSRIKHLLCFIVLSDVIFASTQLKTPFAGLTRRSVRWCVFFFFFFVNWRGINSLKNRSCIFSIHFSISYLTFVFPRFQEFCLWGNCLVSIIRLPDGIKSGLRPSCCFFSIYPESWSNNNKTFPTHFT